MDPDGRIAPVEAVAEATTLLVTLREVETGERTEAILVHAGGDVAGWLNYCRHFTHVKLDKGSGATVRDGEIVCTNHGAMFDGATGQCTHGPCEGAVLESVGVAVADGDVYLDDPAFEFVDTGPIETDPVDRVSTSNVEF